MIGGAFGSGESPGAGDGGGALIGGGLGLGSSGGVGDGVGDGEGLRGFDRWCFRCCLRLGWLGIFFPFLICCRILDSSSVDDSSEVACISSALPSWGTPFLLPSYLLESFFDDLSACFIMRIYRIVDLGSFLLRLLLI